MTPSKLTDSCSIEQVDDGMLYQWPSTGVPILPDKERVTLPYSIVTILDKIVLKIPSRRGYQDYERFVVNQETDGDNIRRNKPDENFENLGGLLERFPEFKPARQIIDDKKIHWLLLHILQYDRINTAISIPETKYCFFKKRGFFFSSIHPGLAQRSVNGISLWDMVDHEAARRNLGQNHFLRPDYEHLIPSISSQLRPLTSPDLSNHINWYIMNFIFDPNLQVLYYLDLKPSSFFGRKINEHNQRCMQRDFIR